MAAIDGCTTRHPGYAVSQRIQRMPHEAQPCFLAWAFAKQSGIGIGSRGMRVVAPAFAVEIALAIALVTAFVFES